MRKRLNALFIRQREEADEAVCKVQTFKFVIDEQANMRKIIGRESSSSIEETISLSIIGYSREDERLIPNPSPILETPPAAITDNNSNKVNNMRTSSHQSAHGAFSGVPEDSQAQSKSPTQLIHESPPQIQTRLTKKRKTREPAGDTTKRSLARSTPEVAPAQNPVTPTSSTLDKPPQSSPRAPWLISTPRSSVNSSAQPAREVCNQPLRLSGVGNERAREVSKTRLR